MSAILVISAMSAVVSASDWPEFQVDEVNTGRTDDSAFITATPNNWSQYTAHGSWGYGIDSVPVVVGDYVYVLAANSSGAYLFKYYKNGTNVTSGTWPASVGTGSFQNSCPASGEGKIFVLNSNSRRLYGVNADTGNIAYDVGVEPHGNFLSCPVTYYNDSTVGRLFFGDGLGGNYYYSYYANNGTQEWNYTGAGSNYWAGAAVIGDYIVFGNDSGGLTSLNWKVNWSNLGSGSCNDSYQVGNRQMRSSIAWNATNDTYGYLFFTDKTSSPGTAYVWKIGFNKSTGDIVQSDRQNSANIRYSTSTPAIYKGRVYVGGGNFTESTNNQLLCLYESNLNQVWQVNLNGAVQSSPAISTWYDNGTNNEIYIYVTTNTLHGRLYCINKSGGIVGYYDPPSGKYDHALGGAAISGGWAFYGNDVGYLFGISNWTRYDFDVRAGVDKWAFRCEAEDKPPNTNNDPNNEFSSTDYDEIEADDGTNQYDYSDSCYAAHRFNLSIDDNEENFITKINVTWKGRGYNNAGNGAQLYIWNGTAYEQPPLATTNSGDWVYLTGEKTSNIGNYINGGNVTVLVVQNTSGSISRSRIRTDYVRVVITP